MQRRLRVLVLLPLLFLGGCQEVLVGTAIVGGTYAVGFMGTMIWAAEQNAESFRVDSIERQLARNAVEQAIDEIEAEQSEGLVAE